MEEIIQFRRITKTFPGVVALDDVSFSIRKGEVHAIVGENGAGKSTLMHILSGVYHQDGGEILFKGKSAAFLSPHAARQQGIATVYQELKLCPNLNVAENIYLGREERKGVGRIDWRGMHVDSKRLLDAFGVEINTRSLVRNLTVAKMQIVEIAKAISLNADVLILDEPTSSLTINEAEILFRNLRKLKETGVTMLYICHRLEEVFQISDRISVLRDGKYLGTFETTAITPREVVTLIAGKELEQVRARKESAGGLSGEETALELKALSRGELFDNVSFKLRRGEILGVYGLQGSGRTELLETIFGLQKPDGGEIYMSGKKLQIKNTKDAIRNGFALVTEDRRRTGLFANMDVKDNVSVVHAKEITLLSFLRKRRMFRLAERFVKRLEVKITGLTQMVAKLSGGNQQKVILSRWLSKNPDIFLMDEPTRGIDVGAKAEIYKILQRLKTEEGKSIIMVSSELPEVVAECDRVIVMRNGRVAGEVTGKGMTKETILQLAFGG